MIYGILGISIGRVEQVVAAGTITTRMIGPTSMETLGQQQQPILMVWIFMVQHGRVHRALMVIIGAGLPMGNR